jgi:hypothetical protein
MKLVVHKFTISDVDDIEIYAAEPIWNWQQTEQGQWVMSHCLGEPVFHTNMHSDWLGYEVRIIADLSEQDLTYFNLRWL